MPVGKSRVTPFKQKDLRDLFIRQLSLVKDVFDKKKDEKWLDPVYYLFDITAGDAELSEETSPKIFLEGLRYFRGLNFIAVFIEKEKKTFERMKKNINGFIDKIDDSQERECFREQVSYFWGKNHDVLDDGVFRDGKYKYGLLYWDPNSFTLKQWQLISRFSEEWNYLDLVVNINTTFIKRLRYNRHCSDYSCFSLKDYIGMIKKDHKYIRTSYNNDPHHWLLLFATNMPGYHICRPYDFIPVSSYEGQQIIEKYGERLNEKKRKEKI